MGQGDAGLSRCRIHDYVGVRVHGKLNWEPWQALVRGKAYGVFSDMMRTHRPGNLPGAAKVLLVQRTETIVAWGTEFLLGSPLCDKGLADLNNAQAAWWKQVFDITGAGASWYRVLVEAGENDRLSANIIVLAIALLNRLAAMSPS